MAEAAYIYVYVYKCAKNMTGGLTLCHIRLHKSHIFIASTAALSIGIPSL